jgi:hypothetical protein
LKVLETAVVDICTLVATCHALKVSASASGGDSAMPQGLRRLLRRQLKSGTLAYLGKLARAKHEEPEDSLLARCRRAAEEEMADALSHQAWLSRIMRGQRGALQGLAAARQDLWRLTHLAAQLRAGALALDPFERPGDEERAKRVLRRLRRRLRKALVTYADTLLGVPAATGRQITRARRRALAEIGTQGPLEVRRLTRLTHGQDAASTALWSVLLKSLGELALDWSAERPPA